MKINTHLFALWTVRLWIKDEDPQLKGLGCDNGYRISQGAIINEYGHLIKWIWAGESERSSETTRSTATLRSSQEVVYTIFLITTISYIYPSFRKKSLHCTWVCGVDKWVEANGIWTLMSALTLSPDLSMPFTYHQYASSLKPTPYDSFPLIIHSSIIHHSFSPSSHSQHPPSATLI
jgi:hypothetical protein